MEEELERVEDEVESTLLGFWKFCHGERGVFGVFRL